MSDRPVRSRTERPRRHVRARPAAAAGQWPAPVARSAGVPVSRAPQRRRGADRSHGRARLRRSRRAHRQRPPPHLQGAGRLVEPARARAGRALRRAARQPRADPLGQQPGVRRGVAGRHQGRRGRGQHDADAAGGRAGEDRRQGRDRARAHRQPHRRRAGRLRQGRAASCGRSCRSTARTTTTPSWIASRSTSRCASTPCPPASDDVALLGFTSGTTGEPKATMHFHRDLLIIADGYAREVLACDARRRVRRIAAAGVHLRPRRPGHLPAPLRRHRDAARERVAGEHDRDHRNLQGDDLLHRADRVPRDDGGHGRRRGPVVPAAGGLGRRDAARRRSSATGWRRPARPILDGIGTTELLHIFISNRVGDAASRAAPGGPSPATRRASWTNTCARCRAASVGRLAVRGPTGCRYLADDRQTSLRARTAGTSPATRSRRTRTDASTSPRAPTT